ncbi:hypothetical protein BDV11DRAFT_189717 [Aspergillus similis]
MLSQLVRGRSAASQLRLLKGRSLSQPFAKLRHHSHTSRLSSLQSSASRSSPENRSRRSSFQSSRKLATAADTPIVDRLSHLDNFDQSSYSSDLRQKQEWNSFLPAQGEFDPSSLIIMDDELLTKPKILRRVNGIGGDHDEMLANLELSMKLGDFARASNLINRLRDEFHPVGSKAYLDYHNKLLQSMVSHAIQKRDLDLARQAQRWFEVDMPYGGVEADPTTFATMIRMALRLFYGPKRDRAVRRYWGLAKGKECEELVLSVPVLSEVELGELSEICSADLQRLAINSMQPEFGKVDEPVPNNVPEVMAVEQKGLGLSSLKDSMSSVFADDAKKTPAMDDESKELYQQRRQQQLEADVMKSAVNRWRQENKIQQQFQPDVFENGKQLGPLLRQWNADLIVRIEEEFKEIEKARTASMITDEVRERVDYGPYLRMVKPEELASLTILTTINNLTRNGLDKGIKLAPLAVAIGNDVYEEVALQRMVERRKKEMNSAHRVKLIKQIFLGRKDRDKLKSINWKNALKSMEQEEPDIVWATAIKAKVGAVLMSLLYDVAKVPVPVNEAAAAKKIKRRDEIVMQPVFQHSYQITWGRRTGYIHVNPEMIKLLTREPAEDLLGRQLPMLCKPRPWKGYKDGAYFYHQNLFVRSTPGESLQPTYVKAALENDGLKMIRKGLDILGGTGWVINRDVFNVMLEAWNTGEPIADLAPLDPELPIPPKPSPEEGYEAEKEWHTKVRDIENQRGGYHSQRCFQNFQMEVARSYLNETFYLPHNMDFRGRAYPIPPYLNQMAADNARGLLLFSEAKPLGESGLRWLKIQIANLAGFDKASLSEREQFAMDHLDDVLDSANNGLRGRRWWLQAEDPWQCLAACCELRNALQHPNPTEYASRLPIHQDGSCNGLQHYAALGGDKLGAQQVNLEPSDRPSDVYSAVAQYVKEAVAREAAQGDPIAKMLEGKITRKVVKQTVMTNVYGVTFIGAMKQIRKQLANYYPELSDHEKKTGAIYVARKVFQALGTMFEGARDIQHWLGDSANRITQSLPPEQIEDLAKEVLNPSSSTLPLTSRGKSKKSLSSSDPSAHFKTTVIWTTPLGLPVVQPYRNRLPRRVVTSFQSLSVVEQDSRYCVTRRKQLQAFPPNFIHSLDATHMMLSAIACHQAGLTFSAVHDSFWTHPSDVDSMNRILREAFVQMHSDDVVKRLAAEFEVRYGRNLHYARVPRWSRLGRVVADFRKNKPKSTRLLELIEEYKRQKLLRSDDPELQAQGRAMVTAASCFEAAGGTDDDLVVHASLGEAAVGHVPEDLEAAEKRASGMETDGSDPAVATLLGTGSWEQDAKPELSEEERELEAMMDETDEPAKKKKKRTTEYIWLWMPMRFRPVPTKGAWDVSRIRESKYFFS